MIRYCPFIESLKPYQAGKPIDELAREFGLESISKLASNERAFPISDGVKKSIVDLLSQVNRYPDNNGFLLKSALVKHYQDEISLSNEQIILGCGSSNILELAARIAACSSDDEVIFSEYAFALYALITKSLGLKSVCTPSVDYGHDLELMFGAITTKTKLIYIANPNNPSGSFLSDEQIYHFLSKVPSHILIVLDEAYVEYVQDYQTLHFLKEFDNLLITRTFSKAYGLAGLRVGYGLANELIIDRLNRIRAPFNVSELAQVAAKTSLDESKNLKKIVELNNQGLLQLVKGVEALNLAYIPSKANFLSIKVSDPQMVYQKLLKQAVIVRPIEIPDFIRVSIGTDAENIHFLNALTHILK